MAALAIAMRNAYQRLGFTAAAATLITDVQGIDELPELRILTDTEVESLCKVLRRPGGLIANNQAAIAAGGDAQIVNPGTAVSLRAENNLKLACYYLRHQVRVSRDADAAHITLPNVRRIRELRTTEEKHKDPEEGPTIDAKDWPKTMEAIVEYLRSYLGETGIPLAYVVREEVAVPVDDPEGGYPSVQDEMIARAPHLDGAGNRLPTYLADRLRVWELVSELCRDQDCWSYIKPAQRTRDGRLAYWNLFNHYLGPNNVDNMATTAEKRLQVTSYHGEKKRWNFEKYVKTHVDQHAILSSLTEHGYSGIDARSKVRHLMEGIKTRELDSVKTQIMASANLRNDFDACVTLYKDYIQQMRSSQTPSEVNISALGTGGAHQAEVEDRYYTGKEYNALSKEQKDALRMKRKARGHQPGQQKKKQKVAGNKELEKLSRQVSQMASIVSKIPTVTDSDDGEDDDDKPSGGGNRNNPALTRQKKGKKD